MNFSMLTILDTARIKMGNGGISPMDFPSRAARGLAFAHTQRHAKSVGVPFSGKPGLGTTRPLTRLFAVASGARIRHRENSREHHGGPSIEAGLVAGEKRQMAMFRFGLGSTRIGMPTTTCTSTGWSWKRSLAGRYSRLRTFIISTASETTTGRRTSNSGSRSNHRGNVLANRNIARLARALPSAEVAL